MEKGSVKLSNFGPKRAVHLKNVGRIDNSKLVVPLDEQQNFETVADIRLKILQRAARLSSPGMDGVSADVLQIYN